MATLDLESFVESFAPSNYIDDVTTDIYLDPNDGKIWLFENTGNSWPESAHHGRDVLIGSFRNGVIPETVVNAIKESKEELQGILDRYLGSEWDGNNYVGQWKSDDRDEFDRIDRPEINELIGYYTDPEEWFRPILNELKEWVCSGDTSQDIIDEQYCGYSLDEDGCCDPEAAVKWLEEVRKEWEQKG